MLYNVSLLSLCLPTHISLDRNDKQYCLYCLMGAVHLLNIVKCFISLKYAVFPLTHVQ